MTSAPSISKVRGPKSLIEVANRLKNKQVDGLLVRFQEQNVAVNRVLAMLGLMLWIGFWYIGGPGEPRTPRGWNYPQAVALLPYTIPMLIASTLWWIAVRKQWVKPHPINDVVGSIANFIGIGIMLHIAWDMMVVCSIFLPQACITIGVRFRRVFFYLSIAAAVFVVEAASPPNYWPTRPPFALFAVVLVIFLPLAVMRLLNVLREVSEESIRSRDAQSRFIATMSHELRTPLNNVVNAAEFIDSSKLPEEERRVLEALSANAIALRHRVNDVLDVRAIEAGQLGMQSSAFTLKGVVKTVTDVVAPQAEAKNISFTTLLADDVATRVLKSDPARIEQVLTNLTTNAVKYTPEGGDVTLRVDATTTQPLQCELSFSVEDSGPGIPEDEKRRIFEPFYQLSAGAARRHDGVGLGLYIVRSISDLLKGQIEVENKPIKGSIFRWRLRVADAPPDERPTQILNLEQALKEHRDHVPQPLRCLIVDDHEPNRDMLRRMLHRAGHRMVAVTGGAAAIAAIEAEWFDVVLLDLHMPRVSGWDVLAHFGKPNAGRVPAFIVVSADSIPETVDSVKAFGAKAFLMKPIAFGQLLSALERCASGSSETTDVSTLLTLVDQTPLEFLNDHGGPRAMQIFIEACSTSITTNLAALRQALASRAFESAQYHVHALKNEFANVVAKEGVAACDTLSTQIKQGDVLPAAIDSIERVCATVVARLTTTAANASIESRQRVSR
jgi:two-component system sensor histidine kinase RpfC